jgi:hypothetical protein
MAVALLEFCYKSHTEASRAKVMFSVLGHVRRKFSVSYSACGSETETKDPCSNENTRINRAQLLLV